MLLAIDAGNTNIVFAIYDGEKQVEQCRFETHLETDSNIAKLINEIAQKYPDIKNAIISSVVPKVNDALDKACTYLLRVEPVFVSHENIDVEITLDKPDEIGADRLVNAVAVLSDYKAPAIVVDFGTATTFDVINGQGQYCGGVIAPGINLSLRALGMAAAKLPDIDVAKPDKVIGTNTVDAMQSGIYWGYIGLIEGTLKRIADEMGTKPLVIATGGLAPLFDTGTDMIDTIDSDLIMKGLLRIQKQLSENTSRKTA